jgi:hypothetical protein
MIRALAFGLSAGALLMASPASGAVIDWHDVVNGDLAKVRAAVEAGADVNAPVESGNLQGGHIPPLHVAAQHNQEDLARYLVGKGARLESSEEYAPTPLEEAAEFGAFNLALWLLDAAPRPSQDYLERAFRAGLDGASRAHYEETRPDRAFALAARAVERGLPRDGACVRWAVHQNAAGGPVVVLRWLVEVIGANPDLGAETRDDRGDKKEFGPPIVDAARHGTLETVRYLVERGIDPNKADGAPLLGATERGDPEVVAFLLGHGARPDVRDSDGYTPMYRASRAGREPVVKAFAAAGVKLEPSEEADLAALRAKWERLQQEDLARWAAQERRRHRENLAIKIPLFLLWGLYLAASIAGRGSGTMSSVNLVAGPLLAGVGAGLIVGFAFSLAFSSSHGGYAAIADGTPIGVLVGLATLVALAVLGWRGRADLAAQPWLYYAGPALSVGIPAAISIIPFGK